jgi:hypothetical protein
MQATMPAETRVRLMFYDEYGPKQAWLHPRGLPNPSADTCPERLVRYENACILMLRVWQWREQYLSSAHAIIHIWWHFQDCYFARPDREALRHGQSAKMQGVPKASLPRGTEKSQWPHTETGAT